MKPRVPILLLLAFTCWAASDGVAARLAREARDAERSGQYVRAYLLYAEAAARDPNNPTYRANRDSLSSAANLLTKGHVESADISADVAAAQNDAQAGVSEPPIERVSEKIWEQDDKLRPLPHLNTNGSVASFDLRGNEKSLFPQVATAYGIRATVDPQLQPGAPIAFQIDHADFRTAMQALTAATHTFLFPISDNEIFVARDTTAKRRELEPQVVLTVDLPNVVDPKDLIDATTAVRGALHLQSMGWDSSARTVIIRDRVTRARVARSLLEALLLPRAQVSIRVELLEIDTDRSYHYGLSLPTSFQLIDFGKLGGLNSVLPTVANAMSFLAFGGGASLFGIGVSDATLFATYSNSFAQHLFDATVVAANGQAASFHVGDKYPIPQTLYTGFQQSAGSIYNPIGEVTLEDLGLILKLTPYVSGDGDVSLYVEADYKALGTQSINTVPEITERQFQGNVRLRQDEWAVIAGVDESTHSVGRTGIPGLSAIPGLNQVFSENTRSDDTVKTLVVIKPTITRLPMSGWISPQYLIGPVRGERVIL